MLAPTTKSASNRITKLIPAPIRRIRLLLASDSPERIRNLRSALDQPEFDLTCVHLSGSWGDLPRAHPDEPDEEDCEYDVVALDVLPGQLAAMLAALRASEQTAGAVILVEASRINQDANRQDANQVGILPRYRAMPCSQAEMIDLLRKSGEKAPTRSPRGML